jgi:hypothetical protein
VPRLVEAEVFFGPLDVLRSDAGVQLERGEGAARDEVDDREGGEGDPEDQRNHLEQADADQPDQGRPPSENRLAAD